MGGGTKSDFGSSGCPKISVSINKRSSGASVQVISRSNNSPDFYLTDDKMIHISIVANCIHGYQAHFS